MSNSQRLLDLPKCGHTGKAGHRKRSSALRHIKSIESRGQRPAFGRLEPYLCEHCERWHVGHRAR